jgi:RNA polymerase sigma-70 factor (family 1)
MHNTVNHKPATMIKCNYKNGENNLSIETIFHKYNPRVIRYANKLIGNQTVAEDIAADIFSKYVTKQNDFPNEFAVLAFLDISTKNACINHIKHLQRVKKNHKNILADLQEFDVDKISQIEAIIEVRKVVKSLPESCRRIFLMAFMEGMSNQEIAQLLNLSPNTVKNQKHRGLVLIKKRYKTANNFCSSKHPINAD